MRLFYSILVRSLFTLSLVAPAALRPLNQIYSVLFCKLIHWAKNQSGQTSGKGKSMCYSRAHFFAVVVVVRISILCMALHCVHVWIELREPNENNKMHSSSTSNCSEWWCSVSCIIINIISISPLCVFVCKSANYSNACESKNESSQTRINLPHSQQYIDRH